MSARGGRGGRGGKGYTPPSGAQLYLKRSAQEAGLDQNNLKTLQDLIKPGALYPDLKWHSNGTIWSEDDEDDMTVATNTKRSSSTVHLIQKGRDVRSRMQAQYQVRPTQEQDVKRYEVAEQQKDSFTILTNPSDAAERLGSAYVPQELLSSAAAKKKKAISSRQEKSSAASDNKKKSTNLTDLEEKELKRQTDAEQDEDAAALELSQELSDDEEESADYTMNYYESEGEESDAGVGDGGEPTF